MAGKAFCTRCGTRFTDEPAVPELTPISSWPATVRPWWRTGAAAVAGVVLVVGLGGGAWYAFGRSSSPASAASSPTDPAAAATSQAPGSSLAGGTATPGSSPATPASQLSTSASVPGPVTVDAAAAGSAAAPPVAVFLDQYFNAINAHDAQSYDALLGSQTQLTQAQFDQGYGSTADTNEVLHSVDPAADGDLVAQVTFTSHQNADTSASHSTCTSWTISLYLEAANSSYLIDKPPSGYHADFASCG